MIDFNVFLFVFWEERSEVGVVYGSPLGGWGDIGVCFRPGTINPACVCTCMRAVDVKRGKMYNV